MGITVKNASNGETIIDFQGDKYFTPASNVKLNDLYPLLTLLSDAGIKRVFVNIYSKDGTEIKDIEDKSKVLSYVGHMPMYARKHSCKKCGYEWQ